MSFLLGSVACLGVLSSIGEGLHLRRIYHMRPLMSTTFFQIEQLFSWGCKTPVFSMVSGSPALRWCGCCGASAGRDRIGVRTLCHRATLCPVWGFSVPCAVRSWLWVGCLHPPPVCGAVWASVGAVGASSISLGICTHPVPLSCPVAALCALCAALTVCRALRHPCGRSAALRGLWRVLWPLWAACAVWGG